jgi:hypothetical protein
MPDDQTLQPKNGIAGSSDRSDDSPSSARLSAGGAEAPRWAERIGVVQHRRATLADHIPSLTQIRQLLRQGTPAQVATAAAVLCCLGLGAATLGTGGASDGGRSEASRSAVEEPASRSMERTQPDGAAPADAAAAAKAETAAPAPPAALPAQPAQPSPAVPAKAEKPKKPKKQLPPGHRESGPVAGLSDVQMNNAKAIVWTGVDMKMPRRALVIAVATAMQESELLNRASEVLPESKNYPHQGTGWDHDSVGLFQQRTSTGWGSVQQLMDPAYASQAFYGALMQIPGWQGMQLTDAAQAVQVSAFGWLYGQHEGRAQQVVDALTDVP